MEYIVGLIIVFTLTLIFFWLSYNTNHNHEHHRSDDTSNTNVVINQEHHPIYRQVPFWNSYNPRYSWSSRRSLWPYSQIARSSRASNSWYGNRGHVHVINNSSGRSGHGSGRHSHGGRRRR